MVRKNMKQGVFITFEGNDGSGKTTVCKAVQEELIKMDTTAFILVSQAEARLQNPFVIYY